MTNKEALTAVLTPYQGDEFTLEKALLDNSIIPNKIYEQSNEVPIAKASIDILEGMLALSGVSEGGFRMGFDQKGARLKLLSLAKKHKLVDVLERHGDIISSNDAW